MMVEMVVWSVLVGECEGLIERSVCLSEEKRKKTKGRTGMASQKREKR